jgi:hypothetical protein
MILGSVAGLIGLWSMPPDPAELDTVVPPAVSIWQPYEYGEIPAGAEMAANAISSPVEATTTVAPTTTAPSTKTARKTACNEALQIALNVGWPADQMARLSVVLYRESRCAVTGRTHNPSDPMGGSYGAAQINGYWCQPTTYWPKGWLQTKGIVATCDDLFNPETNLKAALAIWRNSGWLPWGFSD